MQNSNTLRKKTDFSAANQSTKTLTIGILKMMCKFARQLRPMFGDALGCGDISRTKQEVLDFITWENVIKYKGEKNLDDGDL